MANFVQSLKRRLGGRRKAEFDSRFPAIDGRSYIDVITTLERALQAEWYLEIGTRTGSSLSRIGCNFVSIDPEFALGFPVYNKSRRMFFFQQTSDDFFAGAFLRHNDITPDLAFIDGMHHFEYVLRDFANCERAMNSGGAILLHDVCPTNVPMATRSLERLEKRLPWTGDVWKFIVILRKYRPDLELTVLDARKTGIAVVRNLDRRNSYLLDNYDRLVEEFIALDLETFGPEEFYSLARPVATAGFIADLQRT